MNYLDVAKQSLDQLRESRSSQEPPSQAEEVAGMGLDQFARAGLIVRVSSEFLGCDVLFVSDNVPHVAIQEQGLAVYRAHDLKKLAMLKPSPRDLRTVHAVMDVFGAHKPTVTSVARRGQESALDFRGR